MVQVVDSRMNVSLETAETLEVYVWSDSDPEGMEIRLMETGLNTDTFEGKVNFGNYTKSSENRLFVSSGDTIMMFHKNLVDSKIIEK